MKGEKKMKTITKEELDMILENHKKWFNNLKDGICADLTNADLRGVNLTDANLSYANLTNADLRYANLTDADLRGVNLTDVKFNELTSFYALQCPEVDSFVCFKKLKNNVIAKLKIPAKAKRSSATSRKCRASEAKVLEMWNATTKEKVSIGYSQYDETFTYEIGKTVKPKEKFDEDRWNECSSGIHFFMTLAEAENY